MQQIFSLYVSRLSAAGILGQSAAGSGWEDGWLCVSNGTRELSALHAGLPGGHRAADRPGEGPTQQTLPGGTHKFIKHKQKRLFFKAAGRCGMLSACVYVLGPGRCGGPPASAWPGGRKTAAAHFCRHPISSGGRSPGRHWPLLLQRPEGRSPRKCVCFWKYSFFLFGKSLEINLQIIHIWWSSLCRQKDDLFWYKESCFSFCCTTCCLLFSRLNRFPNLNYWAFTVLDSFRLCCNYGFLSIKHILCCGHSLHAWYYTEIAK